MSQITKFSGFSAHGNEAKNLDTAKPQKINYQKLSGLPSRGIVSAMVFISHLPLIMSQENNSCANLNDICPASGSPGASHADTLASKLSSEFVRGVFNQFVDYVENNPQAGEALARLVSDTLDNVDTNFLEDAKPGAAAFAWVYAVVSNSTVATVLTLSALMMIRLPYCSNSVLGYLVYQITHNISQAVIDTATSNTSTNERDERENQKKLGDLAEHLGQAIVAGSVTGIEVRNGKIQAITEVLTDAAVKKSLLTIFHTLSQLSATFPHVFDKSAKSVISVITTSGVEVLEENFQALKKRFDTMYKSREEGPEKNVFDFLDQAISSLKKLESLIQDTSDIVGNTKVFLGVEGSDMEKAELKEAGENLRKGLMLIVKQFAALDVDQVDKFINKAADIIETLHVPIGVGKSSKGVLSQLVPNRVSTGLGSILSGLLSVLQSTSHSKIEEEDFFFDAKDSELPVEETKEPESEQSEDKTPYPIFGNDDHSEEDDKKHVASDLV